MTLSLSDLTAENSLVPGSDDGREPLSGDDGLQVSLVVTGGGRSGGGTLCHKLVVASFDISGTTEVALVGDWNVEKPVELFLW